MEALQNGQTTVEGSIEGQSAGAASHAMIEKILSEEPRWQGKGGHTDGQAPSRRMSVLTHLLPLTALRIGSPPLLPSAPQATTSAGRCLPLPPLDLQPSIGSSFGGTSRRVALDTPCPAPITQVLSPHRCVHVFSNLLRVPLSPCELRVFPVEGGVSLPLCLLGDLSLGAGQRRDVPVHTSPGSLGSWTSSPRPTRLTPASGPLCRDRLRAGELQDGAVQEAPAALPPGLRLSLLPQQQGPAAEPPEAQIQVSCPGRPAAAVGLAGLGSRQGCFPCALREAGRPAWGFQDGRVRGVACQDPLPRETRA